MRKAVWRTYIGVLVTGDDGVQTQRGVDDCLSPWCRHVETQRVLPRCPAPNVRVTGMAL